MRLFSFSDLRIRLMLLVLLAALPALELILFTGLEGRRREAAAAQENARRLARLAAANQERLIEGAHQFLISLAQNPAVRSGDPAACSAQLADLLKQSPIYATIGKAERDGDMVCNALPFAEPVNVTQSVWFQRALQTRDFAIGEYQVGRISGRPVLAFGYPLLDGVGQVQAVIGAGLDLAWLNQFAAEAQLPPGSVLSVIDRSGTILAHNLDPEKWIGRAVPEAPIVKAILAQQGEGMTEAVGVDGGTRLYAFTPLGGAPGSRDVYVSIGIPTRVAFAEANRILTRNLVLLGLVTVLALIVAYVFAESFILRQVKTLVRATQRLAAGDLSARTGLHYVTGELSQLARSFDTMAETLERGEAERKRAAEALRESEERYRNLVERAPDVIYTIAQDATISSLNPVFEKITGWSREELLGRPFEETVHPHDLPVAMQTFEAALRGENPPPYELRIRSKEGNYLVGEFTSTPLVEGGRIVGEFGIARDITERKRAEEALRESEEKFRTFTESAPVATMIYQDYQCVYANPEAEQITGYAHKEIQQMRFWDFLHPDHRDLAIQGGKAMEGGELPPYKAELKIITPNGDEKWVDGRLAVIEYEGKRATLISLMDITERKRAEEVLRQYAERLEILREIDRAILMAQSPEAIADAALRHIRQLVPCLRASIAVFDLKAGEAAVLAVHVDGETKVGAGTCVPLAAFGAVEELREDQVHVVEDIQALSQPSLTDQALLAEEVRSYISVPLIAQGELIGSLNLGADRPRAFVPEHVDIAREVANPLAIAIQNARLLEQVQYHLRGLTAIYEASQQLQRLHTPEATAQEIIRVLEETLHYDYGAVLLVDESTDQLIPFAVTARGQGPAFVEAEKSYITSHALRLGVGITGWVAQTGECVRVGDVRKDPRYYARRDDVRSELCVPLRAGDQIIGVVNVETTRPNAYTEADQRTLETVAAQITIAIQNARLYEQVQRYAAELEQRVAERTAELWDTNAELQSFAYSVSHDLRAPLRAMQGFADALLEDYADQLDAMGQEYAQRIVAAAGRMDTLIQDLLTYSQLSRGDVQLKPLSLEPVVAEVLTQLGAELEKREAQVTVEKPLPEVIGYRPTLVQVVANLVTNAIKFVAPGVKPQVRIWGEAQDDRVRVWMQDNGIGIAPEHRDRIFRVFERLHGIETYPGTGIGLAIVRKAVERMGGRVGVESEVGKGSRFWVELVKP